jgi:hypothetical protein
VNNAIGKMPGISKPRKQSAEVDTAELRYHLTSLYALRPIPDDLLRLIEQIDTRLQGRRCAAERS